MCRVCVCAPPLQVVGDKMYVFGGYGGDGRLDDCWEYSFDTRTWRQIEYLSDSPGVRENNGVVEHNQKLYLFGGYNGSEWLNDFWEFDLGMCVSRHTLHSLLLGLCLSQRRRLNIGVFLLVCLFAC